jgi:hypothetical protein
MFHDDTPTAEFEQSQAFKTQQLLHAAHELA